jgi:hypothetical protein
VIDFDRIFTLVTGGAGAFVVLLLIIWGGRRRLWVYGWIYDAMEEDRDFWRRQALEGKDIAKDAVEVAKKR